VSIAPAAGRCVLFRILHHKLHPVFRKPGDERLCASEDFVVLL
jgi:hypothetical protein